LIEAGSLNPEDRIVTVGWQQLEAARERLGYNPRSTAGARGPWERWSGWRRCSASSAILRRSLDLAAVFLGRTRGMWNAFLSAAARYLRAEITHGRCNGGARGRSLPSLAMRCNLHRMKPRARLLHHRPPVAVGGGFLRPNGPEHWGATYVGAANLSRGSPGCP
jgi:hypothetical protein